MAVTLKYTHTHTQDNLKNIIKNVEEVNLIYK